MTPPPVHFQKLPMALPPQRARMPPRALIYLNHLDGRGTGKKARMYARWLRDRGGDAAIGCPSELDLRRRCGDAASEAAAAAAAPLHLCRTRAGLEA